jgi:hypothetical protein
MRLLAGVHDLFREPTVYALLGVGRDSFTLIGDTQRTVLEAHVNKLGKYTALLVSLAFTAFVRPAFSQQSTTVTGDQTSGYRMSVVSRSTQAVEALHTHRITYRI